MEVAKPTAVCAVVRTAVVEMEGDEVDLVDHTDLAGCTDAVVVASDPTVVDPDELDPTNDHKLKVLRRRVSDVM